MEQSEQLQKIKNYVKPLFHGDTTGHDFFHIGRVAHLATTIAAKEHADIFICETAAWLHDIGDPKLFADTNKVLEEMDLFLESIDITKEQLSQIKAAIQDISFQKGRIPSMLEGRVVQDADRLDAIGAIGIARTFAFGGARNQLIYDDTAKRQTSIKHFYNKLLHVASQMNTKTAKEIAYERHQFMEHYLEQFLKEWGGR